MSIDYSLIENWLARPEPTKNVDTFYLYPSSYVSDKENYQPFADIRDEKMNKVARICLEIQGGVFAEDTNIYAPLYRQADPHYGIKSHNDSEEGKLVAKKLLKDAVGSFEYYLEHINNGRPFILAGHSQGTAVLMAMLSSYFKKKKWLQDKMIAAYLVGCFITEDYMKENPHLKFVEGETDTGVIISWNTEKDNFLGVNPLQKDNALVINPLSWKRDEELAPIELNQGSMVKGEIIRPGIADAKVNLKRGVVECSTVNPKDFVQPFNIFEDGVYHSMDYGFYFENVKNNVKKRIENYKNLHK